MNICQSCGMLMQDKEVYGKNKDGSLNMDFCKHCYPNGEFNNPNETLAEMVESCIPFEMKEGCTEEQARERLYKNLKNLKRWL